MLEDIRLAFQGIWNHKLRSALTMLGIIIGIGSIIAIVSTIKGTNEQIKKNLVGAGNYADRDGKDLPDIDTGKETVTDVSTVIVGNRLAALMSAQVEKIPFESGGVLVRVPTKVVKD